MRFDLTTNNVTEGEMAMLRIVLNMPFDEEITVSLMTIDGSATGSWACFCAHVHIYNIHAHTHTHTHTHTH